MPDAHRSKRTKTGTEQAWKEARMESSQSTFQPLPHGKEIVHLDASFAPLVPKFMTNRKKEVTTMQAALTAQDFETVRRVAHGMKGAGGSYGFDRITEMASTIEQAAKNGGRETIDTGLNSLGSYLEQVEVIFDDGASED
jgi:HPt (histidine-containing phosphotransfer) domain-containing protein